MQLKNNVNNYLSTILFGPDQCKTQKMCNRAVNTCSFVFNSVPDQCKTQEMCDKAVDNNADTFDSVTHRYKNQEMRDKFVDYHAHALEFVADRYKTYCHYRCKTQEICDKIVNDFLPALKFVLDWFVTSKIIKELYTSLQADDGMLFFDEDSGNVTFCCGETGILSVNLNNYNHDDTYYDKDDLDTIINVRLLAWHNKFETRKTIKKDLNEEIMVLARR